MFPDWLNYIDEKRQYTVLCVLQELSKFQNKGDLNFILIGALSLLINGYLKYKVCWDVDLLFKDEVRLKEFIETQKSRSIRIVNYDDDLMVGESITSFHTAWACDRAWLNVDYILRKGFFKYYTHNINELKHLKQSSSLNGRDFHIHLYAAHPWDIIVEKLVSPRMKRELNLKVDMSVDIRHIFAMYEKEKDNVQFWKYCFRRARNLSAEGEFRENFMSLLKSTKDLGYDNIVISPLSVKELKQ